jgi:hypothetical protein
MVDKLKFVLLLALWPALLQAQNARFDYQAQTVTGSGQLLPVLAIPFASVSFYACTSDSNCPTLANTYPSSSATSPCPSGSQVSLQQSGTCTNQADAQGNFGAWLLPTGCATSPCIYAYTVSSPSATYGPYTFTVGGGGGGGSGISSITWALPSWLTASPNPLIANGTQTFTSTLSLANVAAGASPTGLFNFAGATEFRVPIASSATAAANGDFIYDSTNGNMHFKISGTDLFVAGIPSASPPTNGNCAKFNLIGAWWEITDAGAPCGSGSGSGTVTHTVGPLTTGQIVIGNAAADVKVDTGCSTDGAGNQTCVSGTFTGTGPQITMPETTAPTTVSGKQYFQAIASDHTTHLYSGITDEGSVCSAGNGKCASATSLPLSCQPGLGDGLNAIPAGTYLTTSCRNETGQTWTLTAIRCVADSGSSTCAVTNGAGTSLLTGAITGSSTYANGTQSGTTTIASGDYLKVTYVADGTTKQIGIDVAGTY